MIHFESYDKPVQATALSRKWERRRGGWNLLWSVKDLCITRCIERKREEGDVLLIERNLNRIQDQNSGCRPSDYMRGIFTLDLCIWISLWQSFLVQANADAGVARILHALPFTSKLCFFSYGLQYMPRLEIHALSLRYLSLFTLVIPFFLLFEIWGNFQTLPSEGIDTHPRISLSAAVLLTTLCLEITRSRCWGEEDVEFGDEGI